MTVTVKNVLNRVAIPILLVALMVAFAGISGAAQPASQVDVQEAATHHVGGEANLVLPDLSIVSFNGINSRTLLMGGLVICGLGLLFGLLTFTQLKSLPVHPSMREVSELIYARSEEHTSELQSLR